MCHKFAPSWVELGMFLTNLTEYFGESVTNSTKLNLIESIVNLARICHEFAKYSNLTILHLNILININNSLFV